MIGVRPFYKKRSNLNGRPVGTAKFEICRLSIFGDRR